jgi:hypothetical protein
MTRFYCPFFRGKPTWFNGEQKGHFVLFPLVSVDGRTFNLTATATGPKSLGSKTKVGLMAVVEKQIDDGTLRKMEQPKSRFLRPLCDYVIFDNSPQSEAKFGTERPR